MCNILNVVTKKEENTLLICDLNIDLLKHEEHGPTSDSVDILYPDNMFSLIMKPTRLTHKSATLIDNIMTINCDICSRNKQYIVMSSISDRYIIFNITGSDQPQPSLNNCKTIKGTCNVKILKHLNMPWKQ